MYRCIGKVNVKCLGKAGSSVWVRQGQVYRCIGKVRVKFLGKAWSSVWVRQGPSVCRTGKSV